MKVQLIVVRGKPEGKVIPLAGPNFKIGRGEGCHLRPNSDQVSREHAEFTVREGVVTVQDLKSRNGTQVNGKTLAGPVQLKDRDLVQVGPLTFAVSIQGAPAPTAAAAKPAPGKPAAAVAAAPPASAAPPGAQRSAPEEVLNEDIDSWLVGAPSESSTEIPTSVYGGETVTISTYQGNAETPPASASAEDEDEEEEDEGEEEEEEEEEELEEEDEDEEEDDEEEEDEDAAPVDEFIDESNPFYAAKKAQQQADKAGAKSGGSANQQFQDTSGAASEILKKLMERRRASR